ncbi:MAG: hypothetical protein WA120_06135 [Candidatus Hydromicrobium sp.]
MIKYYLKVKQNSIATSKKISHILTPFFLNAFSFGKGAYEEVARVKSRGLFIELLTVDKLLEYEEPASQVKMF